VPGTCAACLYEPIHGSAPDLAGQDRANPLAATSGRDAAAIRSRRREPEAIERAVAETIAAGHRTADMAKAGEHIVGCRARARTCSAARSLECPGRTVGGGGRRHGVGRREVLRLPGERGFPVWPAPALRDHAHGRRGARGRGGRPEGAIELLGPLLPDLDLVFFTAGRTIAEAYALDAAARGALVIDTSSHYRLSPCRSSSPR
jgi:hypothetical protein